VAGIATASTVGYLGFLAGPPVIGAVAESTSLPAALALVTAAVATVAVGGGAVFPACPPPDEPPAAGDPMVLAAEASPGS
jgi:hypothetical protein